MVHFNAVAQIHEYSMMILRGKEDSLTLKIF